MATPSHNHGRKASTTSRPTTPLRPPSRTSLRASQTTPSGPLSGSTSDPLASLEPAFAELSDSMADLEANFMHLQLLNESLNRFNECFGGFLYGLNMSAFCVDFPEVSSSICIYLCFSYTNTAFSRPQRRNPSPAPKTCPRPPPECPTARSLHRPHHPTSTRRSSQPTHPLSNTRLQRPSRRAGIVACLLRGRQLEGEEERHRLLLLPREEPEAGAGLLEVALAV